MNILQDDTEPRQKSFRTSLDLITRSETVEALYEKYLRFSAQESFASLLAFQLGYLTIMTMTGTKSMLDRNLLGILPPSKSNLVFFL